jgi:predicted nucleic acid-binding protein
VSAVFADTSFFLALLCDGDALHARAVSESRRNRSIVTTEFVLVELGNACSRAADHADFFAIVEGMRASARIRIIPLSTELFDRGLRFMTDRQDKDWLLTDCISFVVMQEHHLTEALTADHHFEQVGFRALLK